MDSRFYQLHEQVGRLMPGQTVPWQNWGDELRQISARLGTVEELFRKR
jgi:hypothetical protein